MFADKVIKDWIYGFIVKDSKDKKKFKDSDLYSANIRPSTILTKIKIWFGYPENQKTKSLLGLQASYQNYVTGKKIESEYHGCQLTTENIEIKELEVTQGDYFSKLNIGFDTYITHIKFTTKNGKYIEFGEVNEETEKKLKVNQENNVIQFLTGYQSNDGVRALGTVFVKINDFLAMRRIVFLILKYKLKREYRDRYRTQEEINELPLEMRYVVKTCLLADVAFASIIKYL